MDLLHWPNVVNAVLIKALGDQAVFKVTGTEDYKVKSGKNRGDILFCLSLEHESGNKTRLSLDTQEHKIRLNNLNIISIKQLKGLRLVLHTERVMAFGEEVDGVRIDAVLGPDSIEVPIYDPAKAEEEDAQGPTAKEWGELNEILDDEQ